MKQYTRIYIDGRRGMHIATQSTPFAPGYDPLPSNEFTEVWELEHDEPGQGFQRARELLDNLERGNSPDESPGFKVAMARRPTITKTTKRR